MTVKEIEFCERWSLGVSMDVVIACDLTIEHKYVCMTAYTVHI